MSYLSITNLVSGHYWAKVILSKTEKRMLLNALYYFAVKTLITLSKFLDNLDHIKHVTCVDIISKIIQ